MSPSSGSHRAPSWWVSHQVGDKSPIPATRRSRALVVIASALFTTTDGPPPTTRLHRLAAEFDDFLVSAGTRARILLRVSAALATWLGPLLVRRLPPLSRLKKAERINALDALESSAIGTPLFALKAILSLLYYEHPDAADEVGFDGRALLEWEP